MSTNNSCTSEVGVLYYASGPFLTPEVVLVWVDRGRDTEQKEVAEHLDFTLLRKSNIPPPIFTQKFDSFPSSKSVRK